MTKDAFDKIADGLREVTVMSYEADLVSRYHRIHQRLLNPDKAKTVAPQTTPTPDKTIPSPEPNPSTRFTESFRENTRMPSVPEVLALVSSRESIPVLLLLGKQHTHEIAQARHLVYWLLRRFTKLSTTVIGMRMGGRDHSTILHGVRRIENLLKVDNDLRSKVAAYEAYFADPSTKGRCPACGHLQSS